ncbi:hypothetical protein HS088_TW06G01333 [Tripterygium wilfordii]|uniref:FHA domain-containing protein n=1 Tax=Tripterygium wilfordii TaxID=458696 RepID=A0A7J7DLA6_TRIWF|nr:uncharacterized protein LOC120000293 [Tripterygium wilfordii]KAF5747152.1 hypothetical protein HS088_TW06G01333 [Tripterygium wilfordii]
MGALAPVSSWSPEDDLLLKNAVEAGASLESLAKGAVQFSRKFTIRELQERWHALLYDPVVSASASFRMIELERSASVLPSKFNKAGNSKVNKSSSGKRKAESLRSSYYALRRRIQNESFGSMDLGFLGPHNSSNYIDGAADPLSGSCILGDPISNQSGLQESKLDIVHHAFPQILVDGDVTAGDGGSTHVFNTGVQIPVEGDFPMEQDTIQQELPAHNLYGADNSSMKPLSEYDQINGDPGTLCTAFERKQVFNSPIPECDAAFQNLDYSSPLPEMPIWRTVEGISAAAIAVDVDLREKDMHAGETFSLANHGDTENATTSGYTDVRMNSKLKQQMLCDESKSPSASTELYLVELSNSLLDFSNENELLFMDIVGKDRIDKSYYDGVSSLLLSSPANVDEDGMPDGTEPGALVTPDCVPNQPGACPGELNDNQELRCGNNIVCNSKVQFLSSVSVSNTQFTATIDGVICCMLNTEDPEIPCNDDVTFPNRLRSTSVSSVARRNLQADNKKFASAKVVPSNQKTSEGGSALMQRDLKNPSPSHTCSHISEAQLMPGAFHHPVGDRGVKFEVPNKDSTHVTTSFVANACGSSAQIPSANFSADTCLPAALKDEVTEFAVLQHLDKRSIDSFIEMPAIGSDSLTRYPQSHASDIKQELDETVYQVSDANMGSLYVAASEHCAEPPPSDLEDLPIESDEDVPCFSDVEAMILDMDLEPEDQDLYSNEEVSRYQHEDAKRVIIRLEQGVGSYMQRAIASHGALAILYGRRSKYYIKKPEVVLGRATEDLTVDIDLGREGRANTISRRQASISLGKDGSFSLKNHGKCSIFVNGKEVVAGQSLGLSHSCLIEIRGMPFIFELNQSCVERYLDGITKTNQAQEHQV